MSLRRPVSALCGVAMVFCGLVACEEEVVDSAASFATPTGMAVAGADRNLLFVANAGEDALQVVDLSDGFQSYSFIDSVATFFPLRIPVGPAPERLAASADGRFVVVLHRGGAALAVVDVAAFGAVELLEGGLLGPRGSRPYDLVPAVQSCTAPCVGRFFVSFPDDGVVLEAELTEDGEVISLQPTRALTLGGEPTALATSPDGRALYVTDALAAELIQIELDSGATQRVGVGADVGPLVVSSDSSAVVVARPSLRDALTFDVSTGVLTPVVADSLLSPTIECLESCEATTSSCVASHPASRAVCALPQGGLGNGAVVYPGLYLGTAPVRMLALGVGAGHRPMHLNCDPDLSDNTDDDAFVTTFEVQESIVVAGLDGVVRFVGLRRAAGDPLVPEVLDYGFCRAPSLLVQKDDVEAPVADLLEACPPLPSGRRTACTDPDGGPGISIVRGRLDSVSAALVEWEKVLADRSTGGGELADGGAVLTDIRLDFSGTDVAPGDVIEIVTSVLETDACNAVRPVDSDQCDLERKVTGVEGSRLSLDVPLPNDCFRAGGTIGYRVRAGRTFVLTPPDSSANIRVPARGAVGPGGSVAQTLALMFRLRDVDPQLELSACARYDLTGAAESAVDPLYSRGVVWRLAVSEPYLAVEAGLFVASDGSLRQYGRLPVDLVLSDVGGATSNDVPVPAVHMTYAGSDGVLSFIPSEALGLGSLPQYRLQ